MQAVKKDAAVAASLLGAVLAVGLVAGMLSDKGREATPVIDTLGGRGSTEIRLYVGTCLGDAEVETFSDSAGKVVISVVSDVQNGQGPACLDSVVLRLDQPLGDRELNDNTTGRPIFVPRTD